MLWSLVRISQQVPEREALVFARSALQELDRGSIVLLLSMLLAAVLHIWWLHRECTRLERSLTDRDQKIRDSFHIDSTKGFAYRDDKLGLMYCLRCLQSSPVRQSVLIDPTEKEVWHCVHIECSGLPPVDLKKPKGT